MRASDLILAAAHPNGVITLESMNYAELQLVGASFGSMLPMHRLGNSANIAINKDEIGMVVLHCSWCPDKTPEFFDFTLEVSWPEGTVFPWIELRRQWVPEDPKRLIRHNWDAIEVSVDGVIYSSHKDAGRDGNIFANANLICRYINSKITADEFLTAVNTPTVEQKLRDQLKSAEMAIDVIRREANKAKHERDYWKYHGLQLAKAVRPGRIKRILLCLIPNRFRNLSLEIALNMFKHIPDGYKPGVYPNYDDSESED